MDTILILCGSFNPVNYMHLRMFEIARDFFAINNNRTVTKGIFSPVNDNYAKTGLINSTHRINMLKIAVDSSDWISLDDWETSSLTWTKTYDVLSHFQCQYKNSQIILLGGGDLFESFIIPDLWDIKHINGIADEFGLAIVSRPNSDLTKVFERLPFLQGKPNIYLIDNPVYNDVSSTKIRNFISKGLSIKYLLDDKIIEYIRSHQLYSLPIQSQ